MTKDLRSFRFEPSPDGAGGIDLHLIDEAGVAASYRMPAAQTAAFLRAQFELLEKEGRALKEGGGTPPADHTVPRGGALATRPPFVRVANTRDDARDPLLELHYGGVEISVQIAREVITGLLREAATRWPSR